MNTRPLDPGKLDVAALAADGAQLSGQWPASALGRWAEMQSPPSGTLSEPVHWRVRGEQRHAAGQAAQTWLHLTVSTTSWPTCQRCLLPFGQPLHVERALRFVADEAQAEALDAESDDDVLVLTPTLDLRALVEDELLLASPIVPRHEACALPPHDSSSDDGDSPFAALAGLKAQPRAN